MRYTWVRRVESVRQQRFDLVKTCFECGVALAPELGCAEVCGACFVKQMEREMFTVYHKPTPERPVKAKVRKAPVMTPEELAALTAAVRKAVGW